MASKKPPEWVKTFGLFSVIVGELFGLVGGGIFVAYLGHAHLGWPKWTMIVGGLLGLVAAMYRVTQVSKALNRRNSDG